MTANSSQMKDRLRGNSKVAKQQRNVHMHILLFLSLCVSPLTFHLSVTYRTLPSLSRAEEHNVKPFSAVLSAGSGLK